MPWLRGGTVSVTNGSTAVTGVNAAFDANARVGDAFVGPDGLNYEIANVASATVISILPAYKGPTVSGSAYAIMPVQGYPKLLVDAFNQLRFQFGDKMAALGTTGNYDILPLNKGGTGAVDSPTALNNLGLKGGGNDLLIKSIGFRGAPIGYNVQGLYSGWNGNGLGEANYICNRGGGIGGHYWWSVNADNTAAGPVMTYSYSGELRVSTLSVFGAPIPMSSGGTGTSSSDWAPRSIWCRAGVNAGQGTTRHNFNWTGSAIDCWIDASYVGSISLFTSDYRIKKFVKDAAVPSFLDRIDKYRIVNFQKKVFGAVFRGDGTTYQGLIAHEVQEINPLAVSGEKDGTDAEGNPLIQQLEPMALITDLMGAIKELRAEVNALKLAAQPAAA
ncbi:tail fiber domain-containing protein [Pseudomonas petrae]|uniref:tail fiber domain-containing protein n=1 Tax=Pseudomonas petrae TaxID=2912190 RepID=UPI001F4211CC|nr:tail fiber domain-containing protein [Pseudomonas petrae]MCF7557734.1 tail fiber domain-containing protein [Pseudomonas petrae]